LQKNVFLILEFTRTKVTGEETMPKGFGVGAPSVAIEPDKVQPIPAFSQGTI
jgi:hypothetical protein